MCGIVGVFGKGYSTLITDVNSMANLIEHRGPDDHGFMNFIVEELEGIEKKKLEVDHIENKVCVAFGFRRLAIQDLSSAGHQPMCMRNNEHIIIFNGEIYNVHKLKEMLSEIGVNSFAGNSDTEILLNCFAYFGIENIIRQLDGMYSIAYLNTNSSKLYLIRDHLGIKPLYIYKKGENIAFSSEIKAFRGVSFYNFELNTSVLGEFLAFRDVAGSETLYKNVFEVNPGTYHVYDLKGANFLSPEVVNYYSMPNWSIESRGDQDVLIHLIDQSVKGQLVSDVPVGCQLSGGIDSSLVSFFANKNNQFFDTFSVVVDDPLLSEEVYIDTVNDKIGLAGNKYLFSDDYFLDNFLDATFALDHPIQHPNTLGLHFLARNASEKVKVLLSGEGADELLGGYTRFYFANFFGKSSFYANLVNKLTFHKSYLNRFGSTMDRDLNFVLSSRTGQINVDYFKSLAVDFEKGIIKRLEIFNSKPGDSFRQKMFDYEMATYLPGLLKRQDKMTMAFSMENRVPFLGRNFIDQVRRNFKVSDFLQRRLLLNFKRAVMLGTKYSLKRVSENIFSNDFTYRSKSGFGLPLSSILTNKKAQYIWINFSLVGLNEIFSNSESDLNKIWEKRSSNPEEAFTLFALGAWLFLNKNKYED